MTLIIILYIVLLVIFLIVSSLIFRHTVKYSYLSYRFKWVISVFAILALAVIALSLYLLLALGQGDSGNYFDTPPTGTNSGHSVDDLNF